MSSSKHAVLYLGIVMLMLLISEPYRYVQNLSTGNWGKCLQKKENEILGYSQFLLAINYYYGAYDVLKT